MSDSEDVLAAVFKEFCSFGMGSRNVGPPLMDSRQCQKVARDCGLLDKRLTKVDVDIIFTGVKGRGEHRIDYLDFLECVRQWAERKGVTYEEICDMIANSNGPTLNQVTTPDSQKFSAPLAEAVVRPSPARASPPSGESRPSAAGRAPTSASSRGDRRDSRPPPPPPANTALHPDWYEVQNPDPQGPDELVYYVNRKTNETSWNRPVVNSSSAPVRTVAVDLLEDDDEEEKEKDGSFGRHEASPYKSVFDKLTDHHLYTGTHKHRFNPQTGQGLGIKGRDSVGKGQGTANDAPSTFKGNTNTGTDEVIHDISQILNRK
jgi:hypothetical protein